MLHIQVEKIALRVGQEDRAIHSTRREAGVEEFEVTDVDGSSLIFLCEIDPS